jgi:hypothetical protein
MGLFGLFGGKDNGASPGTDEADLLRLERKVDALLRSYGVEPGTVKGGGSRLAVLEHKLDRALEAAGAGGAATGTAPYAAPTGVGGLPSGGGWRAEVESEIRANRLINAIKVYRDHTGQGLKESKDAVDAMHREMRARGEVR